MSQEVIWDWLVPLPISQTAKNIPFKVTAEETVRDLVGKHRSQLRALESGPKLSPSNEAHQPKDSPVGTV